MTNWDAYKTIYGKEYKAKPKEGTKFAIVKTNIGTSAVFSYRNRHILNVLQSLTERVEDIRNTTGNDPNPQMRKFVANKFGRMQVLEQIIAGRPFTIQLIGKRHIEQVLELLHNSSSSYHMTVKPDIARKHFAEDISRNT